jgi:hypothetical protein
MMRIGIDFDNTIACYDDVFHRAALERGLIPEDLSSSKNAVRDFLNSSGKKDEFTKLQGFVYGSRMNLASPYDGVDKFIERACQKGYDLFVISHKSRHPIMGQSYDMHAAAREFLIKNELIGMDRIPTVNVYFELTKEEKIKRAELLELDVFIDDLPEILRMEGFPNGCKRILFDPNNVHDNNPNWRRCQSWDVIREGLL